MLHGNFRFTGLIRTTCFLVPKHCRDGAAYLRVTDNGVQSGSDPDEMLPHVGITVLTLSAKTAPVRQIGIKAFTKLICQPDP